MIWIKDGNLRRRTVEAAQAEFCCVCGQPTTTVDVILEAYVHPGDCTEKRQEMVGTSLSLTMRNVIMDDPFLAEEGRAKVKDMALFDELMRRHDIQPHRETLGNGQHWRELAVGVHAMVAGDPRHSAEFFFTPDGTFAGLGLWE